MLISRRLANFTTCDCCDCRDKCAEGGVDDRRTSSFSEQQHTQPSNSTKCLWWQTARCRAISLRQRSCLNVVSIQRWTVRVPGCQNYKWRLNQVWHRMLYSCTHMTTVGVEGLIIAHYVCELVSQGLTWLSECCAGSGSRSWVDIYSYRHRQWLIDGARAAQASGRSAQSNIGPRYSWRLDRCLVAQCRNVDRSDVSTYIHAAFTRHVCRSIVLPHLMRVPEKRGEIRQATTVDFVRRQHRLLAENLVIDRYLVNNVYI